MATDPLAQVRSDRQRGIMPSEVQRHPDADRLWAMFRRTHYLSWTSRDVVEFIKGWDAAAAVARGEV